jgi:hypothetical protein
MKKQTKIQLLPFEIELLSDAGIILTKNAIMQKLKSFLEEIQLKQKAIIEKNISAFPAEVLKTSPKVSRGENYKGLPWLVLDYPRHFEHGNIFAIRTMFWWGNFFSVSIHLTGRYKKIFESKIISNKPVFNKKNFYLCINQHEWEHHFGNENFKKISDLKGKEFEEIIRNKSFLKISKNISLDKINEIEQILCSYFEDIVKTIS